MAGLYALSLCCVRINKLEIPISSGKHSGLLQMTERKCWDFPTVAEHAFDRQSAQLYTVNINEEEEIFQPAALPLLMFTFFFLFLISFFIFLAWFILSSEFYQERMAC